MSPSPKKPLAKKLVVALSVFVLGLLLVEGAVRLRQWSRYGIANRSFYSMQEDPASGLMIPAPNTKIGPIEINSRGFRGPEIEQPKPASTVRLAFLGGSTTFCAEVTSLEATWPARVVAELSARHPNVGFDYVNAGGAGYSTRESLVNLEKRVAPLDPDVVVIYHATNDLTHDSRRLAIAQGIYRHRDFESGALGHWWLTWHLLSKNLAMKKDSEVRAALRFDAHELSQSFEERLDELVARAQGVAAVTAVATFSHRARRHQPREEQVLACNSSLLYMPFLSVEGLLDGFEAFNRVIREVARRRGAVLIGGEETIPGDGTHFNDSVHLKDAGCVLQAARVVEALEAAPAFQELIERFSPVRGE